MNIFSGSRRTATVAGALWVIGWLIAATAHETKVHARYDFVVGDKFANFAGFDAYSCPDNADQRPLEIKTESNHAINLTLCISRSGISPPEGFVLDDPASLVQNPFYKYANLETKRKLFNTYVAQHPSYISANAETKKAIHSRFGVSESDDNPFDPDAYLATKRAEADLNARPPLAELETKAAVKTAPLATNEIGFKISKQEEVRLNEEWWKSWRSAYGQGLAIMIGGLVTLWIFSLAMGWIIRGFLGIPRRMDSRP